MPKFHENFLLSRLKLRQLRLLTAIADEGTVLKGSQALNIAQPAATKSIKELEDALGAIEELGLLPELDAWVMDTACARCAAWRRQ